MITALSLLTHPNVDCMAVGNRACRLHDTVGIEGRRAGRLNGV